MIGLIAVTAAGRAASQRLTQAWPEDVRAYDVADIGEAFAECDGLVCFLATGATVRLLVPHLGDKQRDPGVVCVDEAGRFAVALVGGHAGGANALAERVGDVLGATPVITTATDAAGVPALDDLGLPYEGDVAAVSRAILDGSPVRLDLELPWALPAMPPNVRRDAETSTRILVTDRRAEAAAGLVVLHPPSLVVGVGGSRGVAAEEVRSLIDAALAGAGLAPESVSALATVDLKADEAGIVTVAAERGLPLLTYPADRLAAVDVPNPSEVVRAEIGTGSVAEAAALAGGTATLVVPKRKSAMATAAVARRTPRGRLAIVGIGPGARDLMAPRAVDVLRRSSVVMGLDSYVAQVRDLLRPGTRVEEFSLGEEDLRAAAAVAEARTGAAVALLGSGDAGIYGMGSPTLELATGEGGLDCGFDVEVVPGITASLASSALLGAPLGHDHVLLSLSDLHTPWPAIERRVRAAAEADLVVVFYNPRSRGRHWQLPRSLEILAAARPASAPVGVVRNASRPDESASITPLADFDPATVDMWSLVVVGSSTTRLVGGRMVTPRGYRWMPEAPALAGAGA